METIKRHQLKRGPHCAPWLSNADRHKSRVYIYIHGYMCVCRYICICIVERRLGRTLMNIHSLFMQMGIAHTFDNVSRFNYELIANDFNIMHFNWHPTLYGGASGCWEGSAPFVSCCSYPLLDYTHTHTHTSPDNSWAGRAHIIYQTSVFGGAGNSIVVAARFNQFHSLSLLTFCNLIVCFVAYVTHTHTAMHTYRERESAMHVAGCT